MLMSSAWRNQWFRKRIEVHQFGTCHNFLSACAAVASTPDSTAIRASHHRLDVNLHGAVPMLINSSRLRIPSLRRSNRLNRRALRRGRLVGGSASVNRPSRSKNLFVQTGPWFRLFAWRIGLGLEICGLPSGYSAGNSAEFATTLGCSLKVFSNGSKLDIVKFEIRRCPRRPGFFHSADDSAPSARHVKNFTIAAPITREHKGR